MCYRYLKVENLLQPVKKLDHLKKVVELNGVLFLHKVSICSPTLTYFPLLLQIAFFGIALRKLASNH